MREGGKPRGRKEGPGLRGGGEAGDADKAGGQEGPAAGLNTSKNAPSTIEAMGSGGRRGALLPWGSVCPGLPLTGLTLLCMRVPCRLVALLNTRDRCRGTCVVTDTITKHFYNNI